MMVRTNKAAESLCYQFIGLQSRTELTRNIREKKILKENITCEICDLQMRSVSDKAEHMLKKHPKQLDEQVSSVINLNVVERYTKM